MAKQPRLHEVAKALGVSTKVLRSDLSAVGFEYKTHMAALEDEALAGLKKKYPKLDEMLKNIKSAKPAVKKKTTKSKASKSKVISSRSVGRKKVEAEKEKTEEVETSSKIEIVEKEPGVTVEQKKIKGGIIRRRRVDPVPEPEAAPSPALDPQPESAPVAEVATEAPQKAEPAPREPEPVAPAPIEQESVEEVRKEVASEAKEAPKSQQAQDEVSAPTAKQEAPAETSVRKPMTGEIRPAPKPAGRNLSAPRRLKIVGTSTPPSKAQAPGPRHAAKRPAEVASSAPTDARKDREREKPGKKEESEAAKTKAAAAAKNFAPRVTKRDLLGMTEEVEIQRSTGRRGRKSPSKMEKRKPQITTPGAKKRVIKIEGDVTVSELADRMGIKAAQLVRTLVGMGQMISAHQTIDLDTATLLASEYGYEVQNIEVTAESLLSAEVQREKEQENPEDLEERAPIVTIMGHVDHGKTSLLDYIRSSRVAAGEAGGITQHMGAYQVIQSEKPITFLDTPGHEAFTKMRARGAEITDICVLVVAADEGPKPQTLEALAHVKAAKVPIIVAVTKIDKPEANIDKVIQEMSAHELVPEDWGGDTLYAKVSSVSGDGVSDLLESILLQAEVLELKANPKKAVRAVVIESRLDKGKGPVATAVVTDGTIERGMPVVSGVSFGKVRALFNDQGKMIDEAGPGTPVEILGLNIVPEAGDTLQSVSDEGVARKASELSESARRQEDARRGARISLEEMYSKMKSGEVNALHVILKGDVQGSIEAIADSLEKIKHDEVNVKVIYKAVGGISESDISLAAASGALVIGFNVRPTNQAKDLAAQESVQIKSYGIIYELIDDVKDAMKGLLAPQFREEQLGQVEIRNVFNLSKSGIVAGCFVKQGKITRNASIRLVRDNVVIYEAKIASLKRFKEDVKEVKEGMECGIQIEKFTDLKVGDVIEAYEKVEVERAVG